MTTPHSDRFGGAPTILLDLNTFDAQSLVRRITRPAIPELIATVTNALLNRPGWDDERVQIVVPVPMARAYVQRSSRSIKLYQDGRYMYDVMYDLLRSYDDGNQQIEDVDLTDVVGGYDMNSSAEAQDHEDHDSTAEPEQVNAEQANDALVAGIQSNGDYVSQQDVAGTPYQPREDDE